MKRYFLYVIIVLYQCIPAQTTPPEGFEKTRMDYSVPISPAFELIDEKPSNIVEPGSLREIAALLGSTNVIPNSFGLEVAPFILFHKASLPEYISNPGKRFLYRTRLSTAFTRSSSSSRISAGLRFTLLDETDLRLDDSLNAILAGYARTYSGYLNDCLREINEEDPELEKKAADCADEKFTEDIVMVREEAKKKLWNRSIMETGLAVSGFSRDSLFKNLLLERFSLWFSAGFPLGTGGQLFFGLKGLMSRVNDVMDSNEASAAVRGYYGGSDLRGYLEVDGKAIKNSNPNVAALLGGELRVANGIWVDVSLGLGAQKGASAYFVNAISLRFASPEEE